MKETIVIDIAANGTIVSETLGMEGETCVDALMALLQDIAEIESIEVKPEYYNSSKVAIKKGVRQG